MSGTYYQPAVVGIISVSVIILLSLEADADCVLDDGKSCNSGALGEVVNFIREEFRDVKNLIATNQISAIEASKQALASALVREYISDIPTFKTTTEPYRTPPKQVQYKSNGSN